MCTAAIVCGVLAAQVMDLALLSKEPGVHMVICTNEQWGLYASIS